MVKSSTPIQLKIIAPFVYYTALGFVGLNVVFGIGLLSYHPMIQYFIVGKYFPMWAWGVVFLCLASVGLWGLLTNKNNFIKRTLEAGLIVKVFWFFALLLHTINGGAMITLAMWLFLAYMQLLAIIFFPDRS